MDIKIPDTTYISVELAKIRFESAVVSIKIDNPDAYAVSGEVLLQIKELQDNISATFNPLITMSGDLLTNIRLTKSSFHLPLDTIRLAIKSQRREFEDREEARRLQDPGLAEDMGLEPDVATHAPPEPGLPRTQGIHSRRGWSAKIVSIKDLCRAVADGKTPEEYVLGNMPVLNKIAATSKTLMSVPGVEAVSKKSTVVKRRKYAQESL